MSAQVEGMSDLVRARENYFREAGEDGSICPCCDRFGRKYKRKFNSGLARSILWLCCRSRGEWVTMDFLSAPESVYKSREMEKLASWGLAIAEFNQDGPVTKGTGRWKPTELGLEFARGKIEIPSHAIFYDGKAELLTDETVSISRALGRKFDYRELIQEWTG